MRTFIHPLISFIHFTGSAKESLVRGSTGSSGSAEELDDERWTTRRILEHWMRSLRRILTIPRMKADAFIRADAFITLGALPNAAINAIDEKDHAIP